MQGLRGEDVLFVPSSLAVAGRRDLCAIKVDYDPSLLAGLSELLIKNKKYAERNICYGLVQKVNIDDELIKEFNDVVFKGLDSEAVIKAADILDYAIEEVEDYYDELRGFEEDYDESGGLEEYGEFGELEDD